jgi:antitoxin CcdA
MTNAKHAKKHVLGLVDRGWLDEARCINPNISEAVDQRRGGLVRAELEKRWLQENQAAIAYYNRRVAEQGLLSDDYPYSTKKG